MNEQELEDKILNNTESWINMTDLWIHNVKGDKQKCFHKINSIQYSEPARGIVRSPLSIPTLN